MKYYNVIMKTYLYEITYLELAKLFVVSQNQIAVWKKRKKFIINKPISIFELYRLEGSKIIKRHEEFEDLLKQYNSRTLKDDDKIEYVNRLLKDWGRSNEIVYKPKAIRR